MSDYPPYPPNPPNQPPGWGQQPPPPPPGPPPPGPGNYDAPDAIRYGWTAFTTYAGPLLGASLLIILISIAIQGVGTLAGGGQIFEFRAEAGEDFELSFSATGLGFQLLSSLVGTFLSACLIRLTLDIVDGHDVSIGAMFSRIDFVQVLIASVLLSIATTIGLVLCLLPGLVVLFLTCFTTYFIVGNGEDAITAIKSSVSLVSSNIGNVLLLAVLGFLCFVVGLLACCVGVIVAAPVVGVATGYTFRVLQGQPVRPLP